ncbi:MAG: hypothetical protein RLZZ628_550 [Bacteroidota bacterium]|jgi:hypothetical protein
MFEILKNLLAGTPFEGLLKLLGGLFGASETVDNQSNPNENQSAQLPTDSPLPPNEPTGSTTNNGDFDFDQILKKVEEILGGGHQNQSDEPENGEVEPPTEPEMEPDEPVAQPNPPKTKPKAEPVPQNAPEPISAPEPEARPMPSTKELEEESLGMEKESNQFVSDEASLGFEPETEVPKRFGSKPKKTTDEEPLGLEKSPFKAE